MTRRSVSLAVVVACLGCGEPQPRQANSAAAGLMAQADARVAVCDWDSAVALLQRAMAADSESADPALASAALARRMGNLREALELLDMASRNAPRDPRPLLELARLYRETGRPENAEHAIEAAASVAARNPAVLVEVGRLHLERDQTWPAADALGAAVRANPSDVEAVYLSGVVDARRQAWGVAELQLRRAVDLAPDHEAAHIELARLLSLRDRHREALAVLVRCEQVRGKASTSLLTERAAILTRLGDTVSAEPVAATAAMAAARDQEILDGWSKLWTAADDVELRLSLAERLVEQGDRTTAEGLLRGVLRLQPEREAAWRELAAVASGDCVGDAEERLRALAAAIPIATATP